MGGEATRRKPLAQLNIARVLRWLFWLYVWLFCEIYQALRHIPEGGAACEKEPPRTVGGCNGSRKEPRFGAEVGRLQRPVGLACLVDDREISPRLLSALSSPLVVGLPGFEERRNASTVSASCSSDNSCLSTCPPGKSDYSCSFWSVGCAVWQDK